MDSGDLSVLMTPGLGDRAMGMNGFVSFGDGICLLVHAGQALFH